MREKLRQFTPIQWLGIAGLILLDIAVACLVLWGGLAVMGAIWDIVIEELSNAR